MIVGILGILKAGAAYVPIDPEYPGERINYVLEDTSAPMVITTKQSRFKLTATIRCEAIELDTDWAEISQQPIGNIKDKPDLGQLAYVIYTSGSTGRPKGVMIEHRSLAASMIARKEYYRELGSVFLIPSFAFDSSVAAIFGTFITGGRLLLCKEEATKDPAASSKRPARIEHHSLRTFLLSFSITRRFIKRICLIKGDRRRRKAGHTTGISALQSDQQRAII